MSAPNSATTTLKLRPARAVMAFWYHRAFQNFLQRQGVRMADFGRYVQHATDTVRAHAQGLAQRAGRSCIT